MRWPLRNNRLNGNMRLPIWYILNSLDLFLSWDMILASVQICVWTFFMANLIIYSYVLSLCMVSKSPTFAIDVWTRLMLALKFFSIYTRRNPISWPMASVCYMALAMIGEYCCSFSSTLPCLEQLLPLLYLLKRVYVFSLLKPIHYFLAHSLLLIFTIHHQQAFYHCIDLLIGITIGRMMEWKILFFLDCTLRVFPITQFFLLSDCSDLKTVFKSNQRSNVPRGTFERWRFFFIEFGYI